MILYKILILTLKTLRILTIILTAFLWVLVINGDLFNILIPLSGHVVEYFLNYLILKI